jgi:shikimate kinase
VGRELQQRLGYPLVDMDQVIEQCAGKPISVIFAQDGEAIFREMA